ncbi:MAG: hypothetical protein QHH04_08220 [Methanolinea sp.]|jgi:hypothetical protein|nr:hypothetical protein [Methanolinea sp.]
MRKIFSQSVVAFATGIILFLVSDAAGRYAWVFEFTGVLLSVSGTVGIVLGLIIRENAE